MSSLSPRHPAILRFVLRSVLKALKAAVARCSDEASSGGRCEPNFSALFVFPLHDHSHSRYVVFVRVLETERMTLRWFDESDASFVLELLNDPAWIANIGDRGVRTLEDARR